MPTLAPILVGGAPNAQGIYERARILTWEYYGGTGLTDTFLARLGLIGSPTRFVGPPSYAATYLTFILSNTCYIGILGTQTLDQMAGHVVGAFTPQKIASGGYVNSWFKNTADGMNFDLFPSPITTLPYASVELFGHSYGGGVAGLLGYDLASRFPDTPINIATFGSPRARGGTAPSPSPASWVRVRVQGDLVPNLPPAGARISLQPTTSPLVWATSQPAPWVHDGLGVLLTPPGGMSTIYSDNVEEIYTWLNPGSTWYALHQMGTYADILALQPGITDTGALLGQLAPGDPGVPQASLVTPPDGPATPALVADANSLYYGSGSGPLTPANYGTAQLSVALVTSAQAVQIANMAQGLGGASVAGTYSGFSKVTMVINNGIYGRLESHVANVAINSSLLVPAILALARARAACMGNATAIGSVAVKSLATPQIEWAKVTDPVNPKLGTLLDLRPNALFGPFTSSGLPSDTAFSALTMRMQGLETTYGPVPTTAVLGNVRNATLQLTESPDDAILSGAYNGSLLTGAGITHLQAIQALLNVLVNNAGVQWGFMGQSSVQPKFPIQTWTALNPGFSFTAPGTAYNTGDKITITGANPVFNKTWAITANAGVYTLQKPPVSGHTLPAGGNAERIGLAGGVAAKSWYKYTGAALELTGTPVIKVSKKTPGRQFVAVSFRTRKRRER